MLQRYKAYFQILKAVLGWILTAYMVYLFFLYLWSTFDRLLPKGGFILAFVITAVVVGYFGWKYIPTREGE